MDNTSNPNLISHSTRAPNIKPVFDLLAFPIINALPPVTMPVQCPICYNFTYDFTRPNSCMHSFCRTCITKWSKKRKKCPLCRKSFLNLVS